MSVTVGVIKDMDVNRRLDYFRSQFEGRLIILKGEFVVQLAASNERILELSERVDKLTRELKDVRMSVA